MKIDLIVSRHAAAIEFAAREMAERSPAYDVDPGEVVLYDLHHKPSSESPVIARIPVLAVATADDVRGKAVAGNLPLHLAALASVVYAIEFAGPAPRGAEYTLADMEEAGARLVPYYILSEAQAHGETVEAVNMAKLHPRAAV